MTDHQQALKTIQYRKNFKITPSPDLSNSSIAAAVLWPLLLKNKVVFYKKSLSTKNTWKPLQYVR